MINKARNQFGENGHLYIIWGWTVVICSVSQFVLRYYFEYRYHWAVWFFTWIVLIYQAFYISRTRKKERVKTYTGDILANVWLVFGILMIINGFIIGKAAQDVTGHIFTPVFICLYGMPAYLSGKILQFKSLVLGACWCWILAIVALYIPSDFLMLMYAPAVIGAWIIPGYLLREKYKREVA
jgi:hypothetical protein